MIAVFDSEVMMRPAKGLDRAVQVFRACRSRGQALATAGAPALEIDRKGLAVAKALR